MVMTATNEGRVVQVIGTVLDIEFPPEHLPAINNAVNVIRDDGSVLVTEVQHRRSPPQHAGHRYRRGDLGSRGRTVPRPHVQRARQAHR
jgi:hypothetical protein